MLSIRGFEMGGYLQKINKWKEIVFKKHQLPPFLIFFVTNKCNLKCRHCFYWKNVENQESRDLNISEIERLSKEFDRLYNLLISGGEPFLREDLAEICILFYKNSKVEKISIPTNGSVSSVIYDSTRKILNDCPDLQLTIELSIDGLSEIHDNLRGAKGSFNATLETYELLCDLKYQFTNLRINVITTVTNENICYLHQLQDFIISKMPHLDNNFFGLLRGDCRNNDIFLPELSYLNKLEGIMTSHNKNLLSSFLNKLFFDVKMATLIRKRQVINCAAGDLMGVVDNNGDVRLCELLRPVGSLREGRFVEIWQSKAANRQRRSIRRKECYCTHECFIAPSVLYKPRNYPKMTRYVCSYFMRSLKRALCGRCRVNRGLGFRGVGEHVEM